MRTKEEKALSAEYQKLLREMAEICFKHDPIGIAFEDNRNEYEPEAQTILARLKTCETSDATVTVVHEEFQTWFGSDTAGPRERYHSLGEEIWNAWNRRKSQSKSWPA